jgi:heme exporter protein A
MSPAMSDRYSQHDPAFAPGARPNHDRKWPEQQCLDVAWIGQALLEAHALSFAGADSRRFAGIQLSLHKHDAVWISGASTIARARLLRILCGLESPISGEIYWKELRIVRAARSLHAELAFLDRNGGIKAMLTPREHLQFHLRVRDSCPRLSPEQALARTGLGAVMDTPCGRLTASQRWRVGIARLLVTRATLWVLDEPCVSMDIAELDLLRRLATDHIADRGVVIFSGVTPLMPLSSEVRQIHLDDYQR